MTVKCHGRNSTKAAVLVVCDGKYAWERLDYNYILGADRLYWSRMEIGVVVKELYSLGDIRERRLNSVRQFAHEHKPFTSGCTDEDRWTLRRQVLWFVVTSVAIIASRL